MWYTEVITAYVLAGGKSTRMGQDKANVPLQGLPMILHITQWLERHFKEVCIVGEERKYVNLGFRCIPEPLPHLGPAGGISAALKDCNTPKALICTCDMPFIDANIVKYLISQTKDEDILMPFHNNQWQPFPAIYATPIAQRWQEQIQPEGVALKELIQAFQVKKVDLQASGFLQSYTFMNINSPKDLAQAEEIMKS